MIVSCPTAPAPTGVDQRRDPLAVVHHAGCTRHASVLSRAIAQYVRCCTWSVAANGEPLVSG